MLRLSVLLTCCLTTVLCHGFGRPQGHHVLGRPGLIVQQPEFECRPVRSFVTHVQTVVQEQPILKTVQQKQVQFLTEFKQRFVTVTTGTVAYVTTGVQETVINTRTRTLTERNTLTNTRYVYIPTISTATVPVVQIATNTYTQVAYETTVTPEFVTTTATTVTTILQDQVVYEPVFETEYNFVAAPITTTVTEQVPQYSTQIVQVQGYLPPAIVPVDQVVYETQVLQEKAPLYITTRVQAIEYHTVNAPVASNAVTVVVDCLGQPVNRGPGAAGVDNFGPVIGLDPRANNVPLVIASTGDASTTDGVTNATGGAVARTGPVIEGASQTPALVSAGVLLSSNSDSIISGSSPI